MHPRPALPGLGDLAAHQTHFGRSLAPRHRQIPENLLGCHMWTDTDSSANMQSVGKGDLALADL